MFVKNYYLPVLQEIFHFKKKNFYFVTVNTGIKGTDKII